MASIHATENGVPVVIEDDENGTSAKDILLQSKEQDVPEDKTKGKKKKKEQMVGLFHLFRFSDWKDRLLMFFGIIAAIGHGVCRPMMTILMGDMMDTLLNNDITKIFLGDISEYRMEHNLSVPMIMKDMNLLKQHCGGIQQFYAGGKNLSCDTLSQQSTITEEVTSIAINYCMLGGVAFVCAYIQLVTLVTASERQIHRIRQKFFKNIMIQNIGWFDTHQVGELNTRLNDDISKIQEGLGDKVSTFFQWFSCFVAGFTVGFTKGWQLTLVILALCPCLAISVGLFSKLAAAMTSKELRAYAKAGAIAEEVFGAIRTVIAFGGQDVEVDRYKQNLKSAKSYGVRKSLANGVSLGVMWLCIKSCYALGFWYGGVLVREDEYTGGRSLNVFIAVVIGAFSLGNVAPCVEAITTARCAAYVIYQMIDLKSPIDSSSPNGKKMKASTGTVTFENVHFNYPARPDVKVLQGLNIEAKPGNTVALVGSSGSGKSTTVQLLLRFYDPLQGKVCIDGVDIRELNVKWLRENIGLVSQEPVLFATTIAENIRYGRENVTMEEIIQAAKTSNAYDFIMKLPDQFETLVGERGAQLSGGQKQRVAIARALVRNPKILLLDEATSALDTESEKIVQDALDKARQGRTTLVIAHRLSTIKNADLIYGMKDGVVMEQGHHGELMARQGIYHQLVTHQTYEEELGDEELADIVDQFHKVHDGHIVHKPAVEEENEDKDEEEPPPVSLPRLMKYNAPERPFILIGCFGSLINGFIEPAFGVVFSELLNVYTKSEDEQEKWISYFCLIFIGLGVLSVITISLQGWMFGISGENLTERLRTMSFRSMVRKDITWYDNPKNGVGALATRLGTDASLVQGVTGVRIGFIIMAATSIGTGITISFIVSWKLALSVLCFFPLIGLGFRMQVKILAGHAGKNREAMEQAGKVAIEGLENIRTVASLNKEITFYNLYMEKLAPLNSHSLKKCQLMAIAFAFSQCIFYFAMATIFMVGSVLMEDGELNFKDVFMVFGAIFFGAFGVGNASAFSPDVGKAKAAGSRIVALLDHVPSIDYTNPGGRILHADYDPTISFTSVHFHYPTRPSVKVLQGLTFHVDPGETLALVGSSGCGKSTTIQLIERFYDTEETFYDTYDNQVCLAGKDVKNLNIQWLRSQLGLVSQEPVLFDRSIAENIAYGDNTRVAPMEEIKEAARGANIHNFITSLPKGYETNVGLKGTQLSGGQKQRVAIARALLRNPKVLLLDEATSALDTESEKIVQEALDKARQGRTCIVIAHRLSTIQNADKICVVSHGKVTELGTHDELMTLKGFYYKLVKSSKRQ